MSIFKPSKKFLEKLLKLSSSTILCQAVEEWTKLCLFEGDTNEMKCLCGKNESKECWIMVNNENKNKIMVGTTSCKCIDIFQFFSQFFDEEDTIDDIDED